MQDIVERLRGSTHQIDHDAADEIERLREGLKIASAAVADLQWQRGWPCSAPKCAHEPDEHGTCIHCGAKQQESCDPVQIP